MAPTGSPIYNPQNDFPILKQINKNKTLNSGGIEIPWGETHLFSTFYTFLNYENRITTLSFYKHKVLLLVNLKMLMIFLISALHYD